jgi:hydroxymethylbilane synthase
MAGSRLRAATRGSQLAQWQAWRVGTLLEAAHPGLKVELVLVETTGDRRRDVPLWEVGGQGIFVKEVQAAVLDAGADFAVHSAKDLPSTTAPGLVLAAVPERGDPRDALVGSTLEGLGVGARVATGSVRRRAQLAWLRPDLTFADLRGNIGTRLQRAADHDAVVIAMAALERLGLVDDLAATAGPWEALDPSILLPQVGQGALAAECRADDGGTRALLAALEHGPSRRAVDAERAFLARLGGGCDLPVGAYAREGAEGELSLEGLIASADGRMVVRRHKTGPAGDPPGLGTRLAEELLQRGGASVLFSGDASA